MKRKAVRAITGLLCAALFLSNMAGISAFAMEEVGRKRECRSIVWRMIHRKSSCQSILFPASIFVREQSVKV